MLNRSGNSFLCPVLGAICLLKARRLLPVNTPVAVFSNAHGHLDCVSATAISKVIRQAAVSLGDNPADGNRTS
ncbi:hypothetical protein JG687_00010425 [Phytophthora cactorum]|uniref:Uncharacterized protein n=1 Tax=Phytophthora cactorum TaxID=29920 RepID=A0A329S088_9STRA|nr:hypothetical protein Pcac1_g1141 [Phytophthora cactorum]KAG2815667.1 hypothetical protein PC112_g13768 [Phytophthora cactorum]KAG2824230.1 hypothetical protein PC111_g9909 [Phytophthora cactorum]KAG2853629.1 hypothetical protein PC113_g14009 [Phytophthora cactorum]KAG2896924.1 hypothetical protein PC114_g14888 [Phytophthora cactorum]